MYFIIYFLANSISFSGKYKKNSVSVALKTIPSTVHVLRVTYELLRHVSKMSEVNDSIHFIGLWVYDNRVLHWLKKTRLIRTLQRVRFKKKNYNRIRGCKLQDLD